ncbi:hypothetical protein ABZ135_38395, partial [Streptomyces sp. NPDC006339]|uniref:hypothetical protein n=1 Tax=Streptomyces sp. NPDC006339 TaxID=3156755 RepID=UPI0033AC2878
VCGRCRVPAGAVRPRDQPLPDLPPPLRGLHLHRGHRVSPGLARGCVYGLLLSAVLWALIALTITAIRSAL